MIYIMSRYEKVDFLMYIPHHPSVLVFCGGGGGGGGGSGRVLHHPSSLSFLVFFIPHPSSLSFLVFLSLSKPFYTTVKI